MNKHLIFGAGLIGGFMAGSFASTGANVTVLGRERFRQRFEGGLVVTDYQDHHAEQGNISFIADTFVGNADQAVPTFEFVWLTVKCTAVESALADVAKFVGKNTVLISCQNGIGSAEKLTKAFPDNTVLTGIMQPNVAIMGDAHLHRGTEGFLYVQSSSHDEVIDALDTGLLPTKVIKDIRAFAWAKLQLNIANAINALADVPVKEMLESKPYRQCIARCMKELLDVCAAQGVDLPKIAAVPGWMIPKILSTPDFLFSILGRKMMDIDPTVRASMWHDLNHGQLTEVDYLNGAVAAAGKGLGVATPINDLIVELIHKVETGTPRDQAASALLEVV